MSSTLPSWESDTLCAGVREPLWDYVLDELHSETAQERVRRLAKGKEYCDICPVRQVCLNARAPDQSGLWGGVLFNLHGRVSRLSLVPKQRDRVKQDQARRKRVVYFDENGVEMIGSEKGD
jgi:hypothetical protein